MFASVHGAALMGDMPAQKPAAFTCPINQPFTVIAKIRLYFTRHVPKGSAYCLCKQGGWIFVRTLCK